MLRVGITGGIGSGKSTVAKVFEVLGIPVFYTDEAAKKMMNENVDLQQSIIANFGSDAYKNGQLNRSFIAAIVFNNSERLAMLNSLVHPATLAASDKWMEQQISPYCIKEAALIFETGAQQKLDKVIGVYAPLSVRINRVMTRDGIAAEAVKARMDKQLNEEIKMKLCDYVLKNNEQELLLPQVIKLHELLLEEAAKRKE